ncbi:hypothetical protein [Shivajiella indica]|uniref:DUF1735 domain-containing protein n=1 Tax=Shivajiella indica TaxID=872115 RepID=A0ABW5B7J0_9BACT
MKKYIKQMLLGAITFGLFSCEQDYGQLNRDNQPDYPIVFSNATAFGGDPYISVIESEDDTIVFEMEIPEKAGMGIKEITAVAAGGNNINVNTLRNSGDYIDEPIQGIGNKVVFETSLKEFREKRPSVVISIPEGGFSDNVAFMFLVTLENNETVVTMRSRVRVRK